MKAYERLNVEVVKFEAQDVITASVAAPVRCTCPTEDEMYIKVQENQNIDFYYCDKQGHPGCEAEDHHCPEYIA